MFPGVQAPRWTVGLSSSPGTSWLLIHLSGSTVGTESLLQGAQTNIDSNRYPEEKLRCSSFVGAFLNFTCVSGK